MLSPDVNVLVSLCREDAEHHVLCRQWLEATLAGNERLAISELVLSGALRVLTHPKIFTPPCRLDQALAFTDALTKQPNVTLLRPGAGHWRIFQSLCEQTKATGNRIPDTYHATLALEQGCEWVTLDRGFGVYPGLMWSNLLVSMGAS